MAFPIVLINATGGSDTAASGAGPATAKTGTAATSTSTTNIDITDTVDLSGVSTAGDAVIYWIDTTAGHRRFARITAITGGPSGSTWHVGLDANSPVTSGVGPISWAIGGKRASIGSATSSLLIENNGGNGDATPGWVMEMQSAHTETITATINPRRAGDVTNGPIILRGTAGAATPPVVTFNNNGNAWVVRNSYWEMRAFEMQNSNGTKTASAAISVTNALVGLVFDTIKCSNSTNKFWKFFADSGGSTTVLIENCEVGNTANVGMFWAGASATGTGIKIINNWIYNCGSDAIQFGANNFQNCTILGNIIYNTTGIGIKFDNTRNDGFGGLIIAFNTIELSSSDNIQIVTAGQAVTNLIVINNCLSNSSGYGLNFNSATFTDTYLIASAPLIIGNNTYNNTSGAYHGNTGAYTNSNCPWASGDPGLNPSYNAASTGDFTITNASLKAQGFPLGGTLHVGTGSTTYSYPTPGAAQPNPASSGGGVFSPFPGG